MRPASQLVACALLLVAAASGTSAQSLPCRKEATDTEPNPCSVLSNDCCPGYTCLPLKGTKTNSCQPETTVDAAVSHLMIDNASKFADALTSSMDKASAKLAAADKELTAAASKAKSQSSDSLDKVKASAQDSLEKAKTMLKGAQAKSANMTATAKESLRSAVQLALQKAELTKKKADELLKQASEKVKKVQAKQKMEQEKKKIEEKTKNVTNSAAATPPSGGMGADFSKYIPGSSNNAKNEKKKDDKTDLSTPASGAGGMGAGFDWKHFVPGGGGSGAGGVGMFVNNKKKSPPADAPSAASGGFNWQKYKPSSVSNAAKSKDAAPASQPAPQPQQPTEGEKGGPCGKTHFKAFKGCVGKLKCQPAPDMALGWAPGTCVDAKLVSNTVESFAMSPPQAENAPPAEGTSGGACGQTTYKQFKACDKGLACAQPPKQSMGFSPGKCIADSVSSAATEEVEAKSDKGQKYPQVGTYGGPCGKTVYKDFGSCDLPLACVPAKPASVYAPGTCKTSSTDNAVTTNNAASGLPAVANPLPSFGGQQVPGAAGGPCGQTVFMNFGACDAGLECGPGMQGSFGPGKCSPMTPSSDTSSVNGTDVVVTVAVNSAAAGGADPAAATPGGYGMPSFGGVDGGFNVSKFDQMPGALKSTFAMFAATPTQGVQQPMSVDMAIKQAKASAAHAQDMAVKASEAADFLSAQLKAAADKLKEAADKMKIKAEALEKEEAEADAKKKANGVDDDAKQLNGTAVAEGVAAGAGVSVSLAQKEPSIGENASGNESGSAMKWFVGIGAGSLLTGMVVLFKHQQKKTSDYEPIDSVDVEL